MDCAGRGLRGADEGNSERKIMFEPGQEYRTRGGHRVRIYANDAGGNYPVHGAVYIDGEWLPRSWTANGRYDGSDRLSEMDIHVVKPRIKSDFWVNVFKNEDGSIYIRAFIKKENADVEGLENRVACEKFTIDVEEGHGL
jgi:hypothetical protein